MTNPTGDENMARELGQYECSCGEDYTRDVARLGYAKWHREGIRTVAFVDDCGTGTCPFGPSCAKHVCHKCSTKCQICGSLFCPDCTTEDIKTFGLCEGCMGVYCEIPMGPERDKLIEVEARLKESQPGYYHCYGSRGDLEKVMEIARDALAVLAGRDARIKAANQRLGDFKAAHSKWYDNPRNTNHQPEHAVICELESIAFSVKMYLEGRSGPYSEAKPAIERLIPSLRGGVL
jgi:hypothetical protein